MLENPDADFIYHLIALEILCYLDIKNPYQYQSQVIEIIKKHIPPTPPIDYPRFIEEEDIEWIDDIKLHKNPPQQI